MPRIALILPLLLVAGSLSAQVLGPCGSDEAQKPAAALVAPPVGAVAPTASVSRVPLPGEKAPNFELAALLPDDVVKKVKLSDYDGKWRVVCFYPADFTFV